MNQGLQYEILGVMPEAYKTGLFPSLVTILEPSTAQGPTGNPVGTYTAVSGLVNIPAMNAPPSPLRVQATERKSLDEIESAGFRHVLLNQCFDDAPQWSARGYRCIVDGTTYDLMGAENDSQGIQTRLGLQLVTI